MDVREQALQAKETSLHGLQESLDVAKIALEEGHAKLQADLTSLATSQAEFQEKHAKTKEWEEQLTRKAEELSAQEITLNKLQETLDIQSTELKEREESYQERWKALELREQALSQTMQDQATRTLSLDDRETALEEQTKALLQEREIMALTAAQESSFRKEQLQAEAKATKATTVVALMADESLPFDETDPEIPAATSSKDSTLQLSVDEGFQQQSPDDIDLDISIDEGENLNTDASLTEKEKLALRIETELKDLIQKAEMEEMEEPMEEEAIESLLKGARAVAYKKKYYDAMKDEFLYFPTILRTLVDYTLIEEAEKHYFEEEDEFPLVYAAALRSIAANQLSEQEDEDGLDDEYMSRMAEELE